jgi:hypothetical protein
MSVTVGTGQKRLLELRSTDLVTTGNVTVSGGTLNLGNDVSIFDDGTNILRTDDTLHANNNIHVGGDGKLFDRANTSNYIELANTINISTNTNVSGTLTTTGNIAINNSGNGQIDVSRNSGANVRIQAQASTGVVGTTTNHALHIKTNDTTRWYISSGGTLAPQADSSYDIGTNSVRVANIYADTLYGDGSNLTNITATDSSKLPLSGGTMTGKITLDGAPSSNLHAATKAYVDGAIIANTDTQDLSIVGQTLSLTDGGSVTLPTQTSVSGNAGTVTNGVYTTGNQTIAGNKTFSGTTALNDNLNLRSITSTQDGTVVRGGFLNPASEASMVHIPHIINDLAGFNKWGTITTSGLYGTRGGSAGSYTYSNEVATSNFDSGAAFDAHSSTAGSWYSDDGADGSTAGVGVITLEWPNEITYSCWVGIVFGSVSFSAKRVKIEAYRAGAWQTLCDITDNSENVVLRQIQNNSGTNNATTKLRYTLGGSVNGSYFRIHSLYMANYRAGDNSLTSGGTDLTRGINFLEKYKDVFLHGQFRPGADTTYDLGSSTYQWRNAYIDGFIDMGTNSFSDTTVGNWNTAYGWGDHGLSAQDKTDIGNLSGTNTGDQTLSSLGAAPLASPTLTGTPLAPTAAANTNTTQIATTAYVQTELTDLIGGAPGTLDTLNELAAAIDDDASYASTLTTALATKLPKSGGNMTGPIGILTDNSSEVAMLKLEQDGTGDAVIDYVLTGTNLWRVGIDNNSADAFKWGVGSFGSYERMSLSTSGTLTVVGGVTGTTLTGTSLDINGNADISGTTRFGNTVTIVGTNSTNAESVLLRGISSNDGDWLGSIRTANTGGYNQEMRFYTSNANGTTDEDLTLTLKPDQSATFAGDVDALRFNMNPGYAATNEYLTIAKGQSQDGGIILKSKPTGGSAQNDWQILNHSTTGDLRFYAYGLAGFALTLDREDGNATFAGTIGATNLSGTNTGDETVTDSTSTTSSTTVASATAVKSAYDRGSTGVTNAAAAAQTANGALQKSGGTMTGKITLDGAPSSNLHAATKAYVDGAVIANTDTQDLSISGTTLSLTNSPDVTIPQRAVSDSTSTTSSTTAASSTAVKSAYDRGSTGVTNAASAQTTANAALPKSGGTMSGNLLMGNSSITGANLLEFNDPGPGEGLQWSGGNIKLYESPDDLTTNTAGNLQIVYGSTRRLTVNNSGIYVNGTATIGNLTNAGTDTDRFLVADTNKVVRFRTGAELRADIGAGTGNSNLVIGTTSTTAMRGDYTGLLLGTTSTRALRGDLVTTTSSTSTTQAATANAVRLAYNRGSLGVTNAATALGTAQDAATSAVAAQATANAALPKAGGTMTGNITLGSNRIIGMPIVLAASSGYINQTPAQFATAGVNAVYVGSNNYGWNDARDWATQTVITTAPVLDQNDQHCGIICPFNLSQVSIHSQIRLNAANGTMQVKVYKMNRASGVATSNLTLTEIASNTNVSTMTGRYTTMDAVGTTAVSAGDIIVVGFGKQDSGNGQKPRFNFTLTGTLS